LKIVVFSRACSRPNSDHRLLNPSWQTHALRRWGTGVTLVHADSQNQPHPMLKTPATAIPQNPQDLPLSSLSPQARACLVEPIEAFSPEGSLGHLWSFEVCGDQDTSFCSKPVGLWISDPLWTKTPPPWGEDQTATMNAEHHGGLIFKSRVAQRLLLSLLSSPAHRAAPGSGEDSAPRPKVLLPQHAPDRALLEDRVVSAFSDHFETLDQKDRGLAAFLNDFKQVFLHEWLKDDAKAALWSS